MRGMLALDQGIGESAVDKERGKCLKHDHGAHQSEIFLREQARKDNAGHSIE